MSGGTPRKRKYTPQEAKKAMPAIKEFNSLAKVFLKLLNQKIEVKQKRLSTIKVMVNTMSPPVSARSTISIKTVDINQTIVKKQGSYSYNQEMKWENQMPKKKRGIVL